MAREIRVKLPEAVWFSIFAYEPYPTNTQPALPAETRRQLAAATEMLGTTTMPTLRAITLTAAQAEELETWLVAVLDRTDAPLEAAEALFHVREAKRLAE